MVGFALLGRIPVEPHLNRGVRAVGAGLDLDLVRPGCQLDGAAHIVEIIGGGNDVVLVGLQDVAMHSALAYTRCGKALAVDCDVGVGAHRLKVEPVGASVRRSKRPLPGNSRVGR